MATPEDLKLAPLECMLAHTYFCKRYSEPVTRHSCPRPVPTMVILFTIIGGMYNRWRLLFLRIN